MEGHRGYRFGDVTRMVIGWLGPHARAVRGKIDWLKFGQALVLAWVAGQTVNFGVVVAALADALTDPQWAVALPAVATAGVYVFEQGRRIYQDGRDARTPAPEQSSDVHQETPAT
jgi:hypothetical protein